MEPDERSYPEFVRVRAEPADELTEALDHAERCRLIGAGHRQNWEHDLIVLADAVKEMQPVFDAASKFVKGVFESSLIARVNALLAAREGK